MHISLHAGELAVGLVPPEDLDFHIRESVERGHAERIGHGVSVMSERDSLGLLKEMAGQKRAGGNLSDQQRKNSRSGGFQPPSAHIYRYKVPVALASDDEGVSRADMTQEYLRAVETFGFSYLDLKRMARQSLEHSFIPGESLWQSGFRMAPQCASDHPENARISATCQKRLDGSEKARVQWQLERQFADFENKTASEQD